MKDYESVLQSHLDHAGYKYYREYLFHPKRRWRIDFYLHLHRLAVEVEGILYRGVGRHQSAVGFQADAEKYNELTKSDIRLLRFTPKMIAGTAVRGSGKKKTPMQKAIRVIDDVVFGDRSETLETHIEGYAAKAYEREMGS